MAESDFGVKELYYGSIRVHLEPVPGKSVAYIHSAYTEARGAEAVAKNTARNKPIHLGEGKKPVIVPALPSLDWILRDDLDDSHDQAVAAEIQRWPKLIQTPLLKVPGEGGPWAVASGVRSAIVCLDGAMYRLKGSGNEDKGFILREQKTSGAVEIRGCAFRHTATVESRWSTELGDSMKPLGIASANEAVGWWEYDDPNMPLGPLVRPVCIIQRTYGDRRLSTHVLSGIEKILERFVDVPALDLHEAFPPARPLTDRGVPEDTASLATDHMLSYHFLGKDLSPLDIHSVVRGDAFDLPRDGTLFANSLALILPEKAPDADLPKLADARWETLWKDTCFRLRTRLSGLADQPGSSVLAYLYSRIGVECGEILRAMHDRGVSWGTYNDAICVADTQLHCNAHSNNVVALSPDAKTADTRLLGFLDLDMAFEVNAAMEGMDALTGNHRMAVEYTGLLECLVGSDNSTGIGHDQADHEQIRNRPPEVKLLSCALRDTLALGYIFGYTRDSRYPAASFDFARHVAAQDIMALGIITQANAIA
jgi:hypothetical protein